MSTRHIAAENARLSDLTPEGSSGRASKRFRQKLAADGFTVDEGFRLKPGYLYTVVRAISARVNQNYDGWPSDELKKSYKTFIGKPVFVNHENHDPTKARGVVVAARYAENGPDKYIEVVQEIDAGRFPKLAHEIKTGGLDSVSMGAEAGFTICSYCHNKATDLHDMCDHVKYHKGKTMRRFDRKTGSKEDILVFESCHKISFFELSYVFEPADETAVASKVVVAGLDKKAVDFRHDPRREGESQEEWFNRLIEPSPGQYGEPLSAPTPQPPKAWDYTHHKSMPWLQPDGFSWHPHFVDWYTDAFGKHPDRAGSEGKGSLMDTQGYNGHTLPGAAAQYVKHLEAGGEPWNPDEDLFDPRQFGAGLGRTADADAGVHKHAGDCPPGMDCNRFNPQGLEQITKDSPNNPVNQGAAGGAGGGGGGGGTAGSSPSKFDISQWKSADDYAKAMSGKPYNYGGAAGDPNGVDCSGYMSDIYSIYSGKPTRFTTDSDFSALGFKPGYKPGAFNIGTNGGVGENGHMAGTLPDGTPVESNGSDGVRYGGGAAGADHSQFTQKWHYDVPAATTPTTPTTTTVSDTTRAAGKYTKEDFAAAGNRKPWESGDAEDAEDAADIEKIASATDDYWVWKREHGEQAEKEHASPVARENRSLKEWAHQQNLKERKLSRRRQAGSLTDDYMDYMYGEYGGTDYELPNHPMDLMYDEAHHGQGRTGPHGGPSGPGGPPLHHSQRTAEEAADLKEIEAMTKTRRTAVTAPLQPNFSPHEMDAEDFSPDTADEEIEDNPGGETNGWEQHLGRPFDPSRELYTHLNLHAAKNNLPGIWSISQKFKHHPETGELVNRNYVVAYAPELHLKNARTHVERGAAKRYADALEEHLANPYHPTDNPDGVKPPKRTVHAGVWGTLTEAPDQPLPYSGIEYHPGDRGGQFVHRDDKEPVHNLDHAHMSRDRRVYGFSADNWGRDHEPQLVVDPPPDVNASNRNTVWPPLDKQAHRRAMVREAAINARYFSGPARTPAPSPTTIRKVARRRALKLAYGEQEAPIAVDTLREEGSAPEDDNDDEQRYVDPPEFEHTISSPEELQTPDLSEAAQIDREQEAAGAGPDQMGGVPGPAEGGPMPQGPQQQYMTLKIPIPTSAPQVPMQQGPPQMPQPAAPQPPITAALLDYFDGYYGRRVANWMDAIEAGRAMNPAEAADYRRQAAKLSTLENGRELSTTGRNPQKGTANMARTNFANRNKVATAGRRQHLAEGPLVDGGDRSRNDQGVGDKTVFLSETPPEESVDAPTDDTNISNTEHNLVARVQAGRAQLMRDAQQLANLRQRRAFDEAGGPVAEVVDPRVQTGPEGEALTGTGFVSADPNDGVVETQPKDASLKAFAAFDGWLATKTGKSSRRHSEATIKKAAAAFSREAGISPQALFPALGIVLREARKNDKKANTKGAKMRKRADEKLEVAAPDGRVDVEAPVSNTTDAEAQASQFDLRDFGNNAGDNVADPDLSTDQNWAPGEASKTSARVKTAGGLLAMRCAEGMIAAGLEPNSRERKYQLAAEFEQMNRGLIQDRVALLERFAAVRQADLRRVASGSSRGAARSPIPAGLGGGTRTAAAPQRLAAHDPRNDSSLFI